MQHTYLAIDLKSYYASAECASRHLDPLTTNLVVADASRAEKTICLAVSPSLKACGIPGRARLFEVVQKVKEVNAERLRNAIRNHTAVYKDGNPSLSSKSYGRRRLGEGPVTGSGLSGGTTPDAVLREGIPTDLQHLSEIHCAGGYPGLFH